MILNTPYEEVVKFQRMRLYDATKLLQDRDPGCTLLLALDGYFVIGPQGEVLCGVTTSVPSEPKAKTVEVPQQPVEQKKTKWFTWPRF